MAKPEEQIRQLRDKYGAKAIDNAARLNPDDFPELLDWRDEMDQHYAKLLLDYTYGGLYARSVLTDRARILVTVGQCLAIGEIEELPVHIRSALAQKVPPREILEVILQISSVPTFSRETVVG
jgi:alkylhydroperoxidase/carboxymuconolactone decarboxylase family protein YurZ